jgi:hypothetical protein
LLALIRTKKTSTQATHTAAEKPFSSSTTTRSDIQSNTNVEPVGASSSYDNNLINVHFGR